MHNMWLTALNPNFFSLKVIVYNIKQLRKFNSAIRALWVLF